MSRPIAYGPVGRGSSSLTSEASTDAVVVAADAEVVKGAVADAAVVKGAVAAPDEKVTAPPAVVKAEAVTAVPADAGVAAAAIGSGRASESRATMAPRRVLITAKRYEPPPGS
ncbi:hypothetical protein GCM10017600_71900 [Streptosporangium carneum]|uniref:Uncharacterized protein n=1 Tax=Streptosporangium carneum TaxID=47481 RepID=A0A9W6MGH8_9ACTN|nr:hypothetical protein GCM10017600_71900 [Streptosporangium carneum]